MPQPTPDQDEQFCRQCGGVVKENAVICPNCGVERQGGSSSNGTDQVVNVQSNNSSKRSVGNPIRLMGIACYVFGILLCATIIGAPLGILLIIAGRDMAHKEHQGI
jgi:RNA polymerase subunit RPABC4/transcription elongation factor Spt4